MHVNFENELVISIECEILKQNIFSKSNFRIYSSLVNNMTVELPRFIPKINVY